MCRIGANYAPIVFPNLGMAKHNRENGEKMVLLVIVLAVALFGVSSSSSSGSSSRGNNQTVNVHQQQPAQQTPQAIYQQAPPQAVNVQKSPAPKPPSAIRSFAVKSYSKIDADDKKGGGEYLNSLVTLMESEGIPKAEALVLIKQALRKANGNAEMFGEQMEKFAE